MKIYFSRASLKVFFIGRVLNLLHGRATVRMHSTVSSASVHTSQRTHCHIIRPTLTCFFGLAANLTWT